MPPSKQKTTIKAGGVSDDAVKKATGFAWSHWFKVLNAFDVKSNGHKEAARFLKEKHKLSPWWSQMVVVGYEQAHGLREVHQKSDGYSVSAAKTIEVSAGRAFQMLHDAKLRNAWLPGSEWTIRKAKKNKSLRASLPDTTTLEIMIYAKGPDKCQVTFQQNKLRDGKSVARQKAYWKEAAGLLKDVLEK